MSRDEPVARDKLVPNEAVARTAAKDKAIAELFSPDAIATLGGRVRQKTNPLLALANLEGQEAKATDRTPKKESDWFWKLPPAELAAKLSPLTDLMTNPTIVSAVRKQTPIAHRFNKDYDDFAKDFKARMGRDLVDQDLSNPARLIEQLRDNPALLTKYESLQRQAEVARAAGALRNRALGMVAEDGQRTLNDICRTSNLPSLKFELSDQVTSHGDALLLGGSYENGSAVFKMPLSVFDENLAEVLTKKELTSTFAHEVDHHRQFSLVTAKTIAETVGNKPLGEQEINTIQQNFKSRFGAAAERDFILEVEQTRKGHPLTENELSQANAYEQSFEKNKSLKDKGIELEIFRRIETFVNQADAFEAVDLLNEFKTKQYLRFSPLNEIAPLFEQQKAISAGTLQRTSWDEASAKRTLKTWLTNSSAALSKVVKSEYDSLTIEQEARVVGAETARAIP